MKYLLQIEEAAQLAVCIAGLHFLPLHVPWWLWPFLFLAPDLGMFGYVVNTQVGAFTYNLFHHKAIAVAVLLAGWYLAMPFVMATGLLLYAHSSFDRMLSYGLKYGDSFQHTHLGMIGKKPL